MSVTRKAATKDTAYATAFATNEDGLDVVGDFVVVVCVRGTDGYRVVPEYGPYSGPDGEERAEGVARRLNDRLGLTTKEALLIVASTMHRTRSRKAVAP